MADPAEPGKATASKGEIGSVMDYETTDDGFTLVTSKKKSKVPLKSSEHAAISGGRSRGIRGSAAVKGKLVGVPAPLKCVNIFVGRLAASVSANDVRDHVINCIGDGQVVVVQEVSHCYQKWGYRGFKVSVPMLELAKILKPDVWPCDVTVKRFLERKPLLVS